VGGGFIGLEMVEALVKRGLKVNVVEMMPHVMSLLWNPKWQDFIEERNAFVWRWHSHK
jgi:NADPH-dependent 2,4-dienoyl-CoA reductase/sulfur reductase-like enzyme